MKIEEPRQIMREVAKEEFDNQTLCKKCGRRTWQSAAPDRESLHT